MIMVMMKMTKKKRNGDDFDAVSVHLCTRGSELHQKLDCCMRNSPACETSNKLYSKNVTLPKS